MTNYEIYDTALHEYLSGGLQAWLVQQDNDVLCRLYIGLTRNRDDTLVARTDDDDSAAATHTGRVLGRDENGTDGSYAGADWRSHAGILDGVTETLGQRIHNGVVRNDGFPAEVFAPLHPCGLDDWQDHLRLLKGMVNWWA